MPNSLLTVTVDTTAVDRALADATEAVKGQTLPLCHDTAEAVRQEALGRVARRTGLTAAGLEILPTRSGYGYVVRAGRSERNQVPRWLEFGTRFMSPRPFLLVSAKLEAPGFPGKAAAAVQEGIDDVGLGPNG